MTSVFPQNTAFLHREIRKKIIREHKYSNTFGSVTKLLLTKKRFKYDIVSSFVLE